VTYALGVAFGLVALMLVVVAADRRARGGADTGTDRTGVAATAGAGVAALLASATSPVAGLFTGLAGVALLVTGRRRDGLLLALPAAIPIAVTSTLFPVGGYMNFPRPDLLRALAATAAVLLLVPAAYRAVRVGALIYLAALLVAYLVQTPVGSNATRLAAMFALPVIGATAQLSGRWAAAALVGVALVQPPVVFGDLARAGTDASRPGYFRPVLDELGRRQPIGRVEVPALHEYWESAYVAADAPLARGWLRQVDLDRNRLFFDGSLDAQSYRDWLIENGVEYVALPGAELSWVSDEEGALIERGLPYLTEVWRSTNWRLYRVDGDPYIVAGQARLIRSDAGGVTVRADAAGTVLLRVRYSRWLSLAGPGGCLAPDDAWTRLQAPAAGTYRIASSLRTGHARC
jgi:hypothetical protein